MQNHYLTDRRYYGMTIPELWHMNTEEGSLFIFFTLKGWETLNLLFEKNEKMTLFGPSLHGSWGIDGILPPVIKEKEVYALCIDIESQKDNERRALISKNLSWLFDMLTVVMSDAAEKREPLDGEVVQLFSLDTFYSPTAMYHGAGMDVSISPDAAKFLIGHSQEVIPGVHAAMKAHHVAKYPEDKQRGRDYFFKDLSGVIREKGTLMFVTSGNCACLGEMPKNVQENEGLYISSHNLDTSWQQLSMIVGVATTWKWVRDSLGYK